MANTVSFEVKCFENRDKEIVTQLIIEHQVVAQSISKDSKMYDGLFQLVKKQIEAKKATFVKKSTAKSNKPQPKKTAPKSSKPSKKSKSNNDDIFGSGDPLGLGDCDL